MLISLSHSSSLQDLKTDAKCLFPRTKTIKVNPTAQLEPCQSARWDNQRWADMTVGRHEKQFE